MLCRTCHFIFILLSPCLAVNFDNISLNRSLYRDNELWDELIQNCGQRSAFSCVQSNIYGFIEKSLASDFYVTDSFFFKKNKNKYSEQMNTIDEDPLAVSLRESRSRWNKVSKSVSEERKLNDYNTNDLEENTVTTDTLDDSSKDAKEMIQAQEEAESFSDFVQAVENAEVSYSKEHKKDKSSSTDAPTTEIPSTTDAQTETETQTQSPDIKTELPPPPPPIPSKSIADISDILYKRGVGYLMTHDIEMHLPQFIFGGAKIVISPRTVEKDGGALFKFYVEPQESAEQRTIHYKKLFHKKLMSSMLAAVLIMKLLKVKLMFILPVLLGVGTAKKILLKVLLFLFPALAHLFKLCSYYHHHAKYHHHHHQVAHHHHHVPVAVPHHPPHHHHHISDYGPPGYESSGPGDYIHSRTEMPGTISQHGSELASWGLGDFPPGWEDPRVSRSAVPVTEPTKTNFHHRPQPGGFQYPDNEIKAPPPSFPHRNGQPVGVGPVGPSSPGGSNIPSGPPGPGPGPNRNPPSGFSKNNYNQAMTSRLQALTPRPPVHDPFYSPILNRIDIVFAGLGVHDEGCRERIVCSMYKNPSRFSPHSNLLSAELSKEPGELQKPSSMNPAVMRYFKYMQAARDGQDFKDCLRTYAACSINTER